MTVALTIRGLGIAAIVGAFTTVAHAADPAEPAMEAGAARASGAAAVSPPALRSRVTARDDDEPDGFIAPAGANRRGVEKNRARPGSGVGLRLGYAVGGDTLIRTLASNGETNTLTAGNGMVIAAPVMITPVWVKETIGFGFGFELGLKFHTITGATFMRFPLSATIHMLAGISPRFFFLFGGGVEKHLAGQIGGSAELESKLGALGEFGFYSWPLRNVAWDILFRYTRLSYKGLNDEIDGSNVGLSFAIHLAI